jgi:hypothetical protein
MRVNPSHYARRTVLCNGAALALLLATIDTSALAQGVQRCESRDGKVTYSNTKCPDGTSAARSVNTTPPVAVDEQKAAAERAKRDAAEAKAIDQTRKKEEAKVERAAVDQKKAQDKDRQRCEQARRDLDRARTTRASLMEKRAASIEQMQKADKEIGRREADVAKACPA